jgi:hypothetical protein
MLPDRRMLWWIVGGAAVACLLAGLLIWWALRPRPEKPPSTVAVPTFVVSDQRGGGSNVVANLGAALAQIKQNPWRGGRIILEQDVAEEIRVENLENVTIEAKEGLSVTWKAPATPSSRGKLLVLHNTPNFHLHGLALDGQAREEALVSVFGNCRGTVLDDLTLRSFRRCGIWVINGKGEAPDQRVVFSRLRIDTTEPQQSGFYFDLNPNMRDVPTNENIAIRDCLVEGKATAKVRAKSKEALKGVDLGVFVASVAFDQ